MWKYNDPDMFLTSFKNILVLFDYVLMFFAKLILLAAVGRRRGGRGGGRRFGEDRRRLFAIEQLRTEFGHFVLHFAHFGVETFADRIEFGIQDGKVSQFDGDDVLLVGHC